MSTPSLISSLDRVAHQAYLRSRGQAYLDKTYIQLVTGEQSSLPSATNKNKRRRGAGDDAEGDSSDNDEEQSSSNGGSTGIPVIDSKYRIELVAARPEPSVLVIGEPPADIYLPSLTSSLRLRSAEDRKTVVRGLEERVSSDSNIKDEDVQALFWDTEKLPAEQVKKLAEYAWDRHLKQPTLSSSEETTSSSSPEKSNGNNNGGTKRQRMANDRAQAQIQLKMQEAELDAEIEMMRKSFCDKNRAIALKNRAAAGMW